MKGDPKYCLECQRKQIERGVSMSKISESEKKELMKKAMDYSEEHITGTPAHEGTVFHRMIKNKAGFNPFGPEKTELSEAACEICKHLEPEIKTFKDACKAAVAGNFVDVVTVKSEQELKDVASAFNIDLAIDDFDKIKPFFEKGKKILYLTDNCGEHYFDKILIKKLNEQGVNVIVAGKEKDITNDATVEDLKNAGFEEFCKVISIGSDCIGTNLNEASEEFLNHFETADLIIAKGMGHYECLNNDPHRIVFMLKAKCEPVAQDLGVKKDENVLKFKEKQK